MGKAYRSFKVSELKIFTMTSEYLAAAPRPRLGETELGRRERGLRPPQKGPRPPQPHQPHPPPSPPTTSTLYNLLITSKTRLCLGVGMVWSGSKKQSKSKSKSGELINFSSALSIRIQPSSTQLSSSTLKAVSVLINLISIGCHRENII